MEVKNKNHKTSLIRIITITFELIQSCAQQPTYKVEILKTGIVEIHTHVYEQQFKFNLYVYSLNKFADTGIYEYVFCIVKM